MNQPNHESKANNAGSSNAETPDDQINHTSTTIPSVEINKANERRAVRRAAWTSLPAIAAGTTAFVFLFLTRPDNRFAIGIVGLSCIAILILWVVPKWQVSGLGPAKAEVIFDQENEARRTLAQIIGGIVILAGLYYTSQNLDAATQSRELTRQGQITDRFTKAIDQLGETGTDKTSVRLGGIYALERISRESEDDHIQIMAILSSYIQQHAPKNTEESDLNAVVDCHKVLLRPGIDAPSDEIQAILTVISRRNLSRVEFEKNNDFRFDLAGLNLRCAKMQSAHLERSNLNATQLEGAYLPNADFTLAYLGRTNFSGAVLNSAVFDHAMLYSAFFGRCRDKSTPCARAKSLLTQASFKGAGLSGTDFSGADLSGAHFEGADLYDVIFQGANLRGADLRKALLLTQEQLNSACLDDQTKLPLKLANGSAPLALESWEKVRDKSLSCDF